MNQINESIKSLDTNGDYVNIVRQSEEELLQIEQEKDVYFQIENSNQYLDLDTNTGNKNDK